MASSQATRYPRGGSELWLGPEAGPALLRAEFFGYSVPVAQSVVQTAGLEDGDVFGSGTVSAGSPAPQTVTQTTGFVDGDQFGDGAARLRLGGTGFVDGDQFGDGAARLRLGGTGFVDGDSFGAGSASIRIASTGFSDGDGFGSGTASTRVQGSGFVDGDAFGGGSAVVGAPPQSITQTQGFAEPNAFGTGAVRSGVLQASGHVEPTEFGAGLITIRGGLVRGPRTGSAPRRVVDERRPQQLAAERASRAETPRSATTTTRTPDAARVRTAA